jgi:hypothetical protein
VTLADIKRRMAPGQWYDITNHTIAGESGPAAATVRAKVRWTRAGSFDLIHPLGESKIYWPRASQVSIDERGVIELRCGSDGKAAVRWLTLAPVRADGQS